MSLGPLGYAIAAEAVVAISDGQIGYVRATNWAQVVGFVFAAAVGWARVSAAAAAAAAAAATTTSTLATSTSNGATSASTSGGPAKTIDY